MMKEQFIGHSAGSVVQHELERIDRSARVPAIEVVLLFPCRRIASVVPSLTGSLARLRNLRVEHDQESSCDPFCHQGSGEAAE